MSAKYERIYHTFKEETYKIGVPAGSCSVSVTKRPDGLITLTMGAYRSPEGTSVSWINADPLEIGDEIEIEVAELSPGEVSKPIDEQDFIKMRDRFIAKLEGKEADK